MGGWPLLPNGAISRSLIRAEELNQDGARIRILPELEFLELLGLRPPAEPAHKTYSAEEICALLEVPPATLRRWEQLSLVRSTGGRFDFQDIVSLRAIADLVSRGVRLEALARSLHALSHVLPNVARPLAQLRIVAEGPDELLAELGGALMAPSGQLLLNFDPLQGAPQTSSLTLPPDEPREDALQRAIALEEASELGAAESAYRELLRRCPDWAEPRFNLGNVLRERGEADEAIEQYRAALERRPGFAAAWYNLADVHDARGEVEETIAALGRAIEADAGFADAHFNLALCLERLGRLGDAARHWRAYLQLDPASEWSGLARERLRRFGYVAQ
jgi:tetratricopeptide (TPR) repeat protein